MKKIWSEPGADWCKNLERSCVWSKKDAETSWNEDWVVEVWYQFNQELWYREEMHRASQVSALVSTGVGLGMCWLFFVRMIWDTGFQLFYKNMYSCLTDSEESRSILCRSQHYNRGSSVFSYASCNLQGKQGIYIDAERRSLALDGYTCTMITVFYSMGCEDWTATEDSSQESFTGLTNPHFA